MTPTISVCLITYNHIVYIRQAIEGVLLQKHTYSWEFIIADDFSIDGTREILLQYHHQNPSIIRLILQKENVGAAKNWLELIKSAKGKYIAYFEGDDYWTDNYKLQKQVVFLEANSDYMLCSANAVVENLTDKPFRSIYCNFNQDRTFNQKEVLTEFYCPSLSLVFRNRLNELPDWFQEVKSGDSFLQFFLSKYGKFYYMNFVAGVYRQLPTGISNRNNQIDWFENNITYLKKLKGYVELENEPFLSEIIYRSQLEYIYSLRADKQYKRALSYFKEMERLPFFIRKKYLKKVTFSFLKTLLRK